MPVIAIIGAGPGMGFAIAKVFGAQGYKVALLSRNPAKLEPIAAELAKHGIEAAGFSFSVLDRTSIAAGLTAVKERFGHIDVLEFSPTDRALPLAPATELTRDNVQVWIDFYLHGAIAAVNEVLPDMLARGSGTILFTTGVSSVYSELGHNMIANVALAMAALRNWAHALHIAVAAKGVQVGHVAIGAFIGRDPGATPEAIAPLYWELHTPRDQVEKVFMPETMEKASGLRGNAA
jgi:NAD(P)-dependent dehydrogenase (short-subunit alcohol dehydrogenase family)